MWGDRLFNKITIMPHHPPAKQHIFFLRACANVMYHQRRTVAGEAISKNPSDYQAGDIVSWRLDNGLAHIGVVSDGFARDGTPLVIHNIGAGAQEEDVLFSWRMVGHYRYFVK